MKLTYTNVNGYLIPNLAYKSGEQMEQLGKYGFLRRDYLKNHRNSTYEKKGQDAIHFHSYAKLLFSTNEMPQNLEDKSDAFYRRLLILDMNRVVKSGEKDLHLKEKVQAESDYAIHMAMIALKNLYEQGKFTESEHSKECVREVQRSSDSICAFIDESLVRAKGKRLKRSEVFHMYEEYCKENGRQGHGKSNFFRNMTDKGFLWMERKMDR